MSTRLVGPQLQESQHAFVDARTALSEKFGWAENDARITVLNKCSSVLSSVMLGYALIDKYLSNENWWGTHSTLPIDRQQIERTGNEFEMMLRIALIHNMLYAVESSFRIYVRALDPNACAQGTAEFKNVYEWLLKRTGLQTSSALLDLWRNIRNTLHNNGLFIPTSRKDATVTYKGHIYQFRLGKPNDFVDTAFIVRLLPDMRELLVAVLTSDELTQPKLLEELS
jgi:hypothetical protein